MRPDIQLSFLLFRVNRVPVILIGFRNRSAARASTVGGMVRPCAFAVLRLITSSYLVGACTGRSPGFSPNNRRLAVKRETALSAQNEENLLMRMGMLLRSFTSFVS